MSPADKLLIWLHGEVKSPPFSAEARLEAGVLLRRPMPAIGPRCHELRIVDEKASWRIVYRLDPDAVVIAEVFRKTTQTTPYHVIQQAQRRLRNYDQVTGEEG